MVAMGRALMLEPKILLLDEPSAGLSPALQDEVFVQCRTINSTGVAILMVEQNVKKALSVSDHGCVMELGNICLRDAASSLIGNEEVARLYLGRR